MEYSTENREDFNIKDVGKPFQSIGEKVKDTASTAGGAIKNTASATGGAIKNTASSVGGKVKDTAITGFEKTKGGLIKGFDAVKNFAGKIWQFLSKFKIWFMLACAVCVLSLLMPVLGPLFGFAKGTFSVGKGILGVFSRKQTIPQYNQGYGNQMYGGMRYAGYSQRY